MPDEGRRSRFQLPASRARVARDVEREIAFHLAERAEQLEAQGVEPAAARAAALREFGDVRAARTELEAIDARRVRRARRLSWWDDLRQDLLFGLRGARRAPVFTLLAIVTLALGIGANAAVFGVVKSVLLDALPYAGSDRLVRVWGRFLDGSIPRSPMSAGLATDVAQRQRSFERMAAFMSEPAEEVLSGADAPRVVRVSWVEPTLFPTLGVAPMLGRPLSLDLDATVAGAEGEALVTHAAWRRLFGGDPAAVGRVARLDGYGFLVVGVLPPRFVGPVGEADFYVPLDLRPSLRDPVRARGSNWLGLVGRLQPGVTLEAARHELEGIAAQVGREHAGPVTAVGITAVPVREAMVGETRTPLLVLMASAALVLLITCANLAGALLSRTISRRRELAVRIALGAGRARLVRQLLTESVMLAVAGGTAGIALAASALTLLRGLALPVLPAYAELRLDPAAVLAAFAVSLLTGVGFGLAPALSVGRADPQKTLRDESRGASESRRMRTVRGVLVAGQIALCVSVLAGAGLLVRSLWAMTAAPLGFTPEHVLTAAIKYGGTRYDDPAARVRFQEALEGRLRAIPGVRGVAVASQLPTTVQAANGFTIDARPWPPGTSVPFALFASVSDDYFRTLGIRLLRGRTFRPDDRPEGPRVLVISESMARRYWPSGDAIGARIHMGPDPAAPPLEIVGIVADVRNDPARPTPEPITYASERQFPWGSVTVSLRAAADPWTLAQPLRSAVVAIDPALPLDRVMTLGAVVEGRFAGRRLPAMLMAAFGALALLLASVGVYAMFAAMAAAREREFGVRIALGATPRGIAALVLRQGGAWMALGLGVGAFGVVFVVRLVRSLLFGIGPFDPLAIGLSTAALVLCAILALLGPVRRATRADPIAVLR